MAALARGLEALGPVDLFARVFPVELEGPSAPRDEALALYRELHLFGRGLPSGVPGLDPWRARDAVPCALLGALRAAHRARPYDAVVACHAYASPALGAAPGAARVVDEHNLEGRYAREVSRANPLERSAMARLERRAWRAADLVTCVRDDDLAVIARDARACAVVPNGVALAEVPWRPPSARRGRAVLFVGALSHGPNVDACVTLARDVLPLLRAAEPGAELVLCGRAPDAAVRALARDGVTVTGTVPSTAPWLDGASVFACPLRAGEGTSLKVVEAAAAGLPIVSSALGARGFALRDGEHLLLAEGPRAVADAVLATWRDPAAADRRALAAREVARALDWTALGARFAALVEAAIAARGAP